MDMLKIRRKRKATGSVAEFTAVVPVFALFILIPMMNLGAVALRTTFITVAARDAVHKAIKARSFETDLPGAPSARSIARTVAVARAQSFGGVRVNNVVTRIVTVSVSGASDPQRFEQPLPATPEPDPKANVYQLEVEVQGDVAPLLSCGGLFKNVPGLSAPMPFTSVAREVFEDPSVLTL